jgi:hypothetical protein
MIIHPHLVTQHPQRSIPALIIDVYAISSITGLHKNAGPPAILRTIVFININPVDTAPCRAAPHVGQKAFKTAL